MAKAAERAELIVNGVRFHDWKTVKVHHRWQELAHIFDFTCAERTPIPNDWPLLQFKPGDRCEIYLAGILAMRGYVTIRQVAYDANEHGVQLIGRSATADLESSVKTQTGNFDGYGLSAIARAVVAPFGIGVETVGAVDNTPFGHVQVQPGESAWDLLERLARERGVLLGSNVNGQLVLIGQHTGRVAHALIEGRNILRANCVIDHSRIFSSVEFFGQRWGDDQTWGAPAAQMHAEVPGIAQRYRPWIDMIEQPVASVAEITKRAEFESQWQRGTEITAQITVQGWLNGAGDLWRVGTAPHVRSSMLMLDRPLGIRTATFTQGPGGTLTTLELVRPDALNQQISFGAANRAVENGEQP